MNPAASRPFTAEERRALEQLASGKSERANDRFTLVFAFGASLLVSAFVLEKILGRLTGIHVAVLAALSLALALWFRAKVGYSGHPAFARVRAAYAADLEGGHATTETFDVVDAIRVEELEDEGSSFFLRLADGRVLFLSGQYLDEEVEEGKFPSTRFALTRAPRSRMLLDLECLGAPLRTGAKRRAFTVEEHRAGAVPEDGALLAVDFESLRSAAS